MLLLHTEVFVLYWVFPVYNNATSKLLRYLYFTEYFQFTTMLLLLQSRNPPSQNIFYAVSVDQSKWQQIYGIRQLWVPRVKIYFTLGEGLGTAVDRKLPCIPPPLHSRMLKHVMIEVMKYAFLNWEVITGLILETRKYNLGNKEI